MIIDKSIIAKDKVMEQVFKNASVLFSTVVVDEKEVALVLCDEKRRVAGELICYKHSYCGEISESEYLNYVNSAFQAFIMKYKNKIDLESLGKAKYKFDAFCLI